MNNFKIPNVDAIKGILAVFFGCMLVILAYSIILRMIYFIGGLLLIYYGLQKLNLPTLNKTIKKIKHYFKELCSSSE